MKVYLLMRNWSYEGEEVIEVGVSVAAVEAYYNRLNTDLPLYIDADAQKAVDFLRQEFFYVFETELLE